MHSILIFSIPAAIGPFNKNISIVNVASNEFDVLKLKKEIKDVLKKDENKTAKGSRLCRTLGCRCIATQSDFDYLQDASNPYKGIPKDFMSKYLENDVSNICLQLLNVLILDGDNKTDKNLDNLFEQSMNFLDKQRGPDEVMVEVFYPGYLTSFQPMYQELKKNSNHIDPFTYDQRIMDGSFFFDENDYICERTHLCNDVLNGLVSTWEKVIDIFSFDWQMEIGSLVANFNYLMMICSNKESLQIAEEMWAPNNKFFKARCGLNADAEGFNKLIQTITEQTFDSPFEGIYLNDLIGYLGYSSTFDLSALQNDRYMYTARDLHPIQGMDTMKNWVEEGWKTQCNYLATYHNWVTHKTKLDENKTIGKAIKISNNILSVYISLQMDNRS